MVKACRNRVVQCLVCKQRMCLPEMPSHLRRHQSELASHMANLVGGSGGDVRQEGRSLAEQLKREETGGELDSLRSRTSPAVALESGEAGRPRQRSISGSGVPIAAVGTSMPATDLTRSPSAAAPAAAVPLGRPAIAPPAPGRPAAAPPPAASAAIVSPRQRPTGDLLALGPFGALAETVMSLIQPDVARPAVSPRLPDGTTAASPSASRRPAHASAPSVPAARPAPISTGLQSILFSPSWRLVRPEHPPSQSAASANSNHHRSGASVGRGAPSQQPPAAEGTVFYGGMFSSAAVSRLERPSNALRGPLQTPAGTQSTLSAVRPTGAAPATAAAATPSGSANPVRAAALSRAPSAAVVEAAAATSASVAASSPSAGIRVDASGRASLPVQRYQTLLTLLQQVNAIHSQSRQRARRHEVPATQADASSGTSVTVDDSATAAADGPRTSGGSASGEDARNEAAPAVNTPSPDAGAEQRERLEVVLSSGLYADSPDVHQQMEDRQQAKPDATEEQGEATKNEARRDLVVEQQDEGRPVASSFAVREAVFRHSTDADASPSMCDASAATGAYGGPYSRSHDSGLLSAVTQFSRSLEQGSMQQVIGGSEQEIVNVEEPRVGEGLQAGGGLLSSGNDEDEDEESLAQVLRLSYLTASDT